MDELVTRFVKDIGYHSNPYTTLSRPLASSLATRQGRIGGSDDKGHDTQDDDTPKYPHEDPELVGHEAARRARERRKYRETTESKQWDFMLSQIADWEECRTSWGQFKARVGGGMMVGGLERTGWYRSNSRVQETRRRG